MRPYKPKQSASNFLQFGTTEQRVRGGGGERRERKTTFRPLGFLRSELLRGSPVVETLSSFLFSSPPLTLWSIVSIYSLSNESAIWSNLPWLEDDLGSRFQLLCEEWEDASMTSLSEQTVTANRPRTRPRPEEGKRNETKMVSTLTRCVLVHGKQASHLPVLYSESYGNRKKNWTYLYDLRFGLFRLVGTFQWRRQQTVYVLYRRLPLSALNTMCACFF